MATALIGPLAWESPHAAAVAQVKAKKQKKKKKKIWITLKKTKALGKVTTTPGSTLSNSFIDFYYHQSGKKVLGKSC